jgi:hypothetical protein
MNLETVQVRDRICKCFPRPGPHSCSCTWDRTNGTRSITISKTHKKPHALVPLLRPLRNSHQGADTRQRSNPRTSMLFLGSSEDTGLHDWIFQPEPQELICMRKAPEDECGKRISPLSLSPRESACLILFRGTEGTKLKDTFLISVLASYFSHKLWLHRVYSV